MFETANAQVLGVSVEFHRSPGQDSGGLAIALNLLISGRAELAGMVHINIALLLEARYRDSGEITASGRLDVTVRISRFFTLSAKTTVTYSFTSGQTQKTSQRKIDTHPAVKGAQALAQAGA